jgi:hypothetical protein
LRRCFPYEGESQKTQGKPNAQPWTSELPHHYYYEVAPIDRCCHRWQNG